MIAKKILSDVIIENQFRQLVNLNHNKIGSLAPHVRLRNPSNMQYSKVDHKNDGRGSRYLHWRDLLHSFIGIFVASTRTSGPRSTVLSQGSTISHKRGR